MPRRGGTPAAARRRSESHLGVGEGSMAIAFVHQYLKDAEGSWIVRS
jgi:hypothetical protein